MRKRIIALVLATVLMLTPCMAEAATKKAKVVNANTTAAIATAADAGALTTPAKPKFGKVKKDSIELKWDFDEYATGYEVEYSTDKKFKKSTVKDVKWKNSYKITKLKKNKTYYIRIRAYKVVNYTVDGKKKSIKIYTNYKSTSKKTAKK